MTGNESNPQEKGTGLESVNADLREQQANSPADLAKQPLFPPSSSSPTQPAEMVPAPAQVIPPQTGGQETHSSWQFQEFPATPISVPLMLGGQQKDVIARQQLPMSSRPTKSVGTLDAFISYSRRDDAFARQLVKAFDQRRYNAWFDRNDVLPAGEFWDDIKVGIEEAGAFLFIMSPDSLASGPCIDELNYALQCGKKIIPLHHRPVDHENVPEQLRKLDWIEGASFDEIFEKALNALLTDKEDWKQAGRWLRSGSEWQKNRKQNAGLFLHGKDLKKAEEWLKKSELEPDKKPQPLPLHVQFVRESRRYAKRTLITRIVILVLFIVVTAGGAFALLYHNPAEVTTLNDDGPGSLRYDINNIRSGTITFASGLKGVIKLTSGDITIKGKITIDGPGAAILAVNSGKTNSSIVVSTGASVTISGLNFRDSSFNRKSFLTNHGTLAVVDCTLANNHTGITPTTAGGSSPASGSGGAIENDGTLSLINSSIVNNSAFDPFFGGSAYQLTDSGYGGGIFNTNAGTITVMDSTISGNSADNGGAIEAQHGTVTVMNSTISGNSALQSAGGIDTLGQLTIINSTLANNSVGSQYTPSPDGGAIVASYLTTTPRPVLLAFDTIFGNTSAGTNGAIDNESDIFTIEDSIIAGNTSASGSDLTGTTPGGGIQPGQFITGGYNLFQNVSGTSFTDTKGLEHTDTVINASDLGNIFGPHPQLRANGGSTQTYALLPVSNNPAIGKVPLNYCHIPEILNAQSHQYTDQRGTPRPNGTEHLCDIGAYEAGVPPISQSQATATPSGSPTIGPILLAGDLTEFTPRTSSADPEWITTGPDGNLWFTEAQLDANRIGRITPGGTITEFPLPTAQSIPKEITAGPDGNVWFTEGGGNQIGRITPDGTITEFPVPTSGSVPTGITAGPDGNLWFTEAGGNQIGRITPGGTVTEFLIPTPESALEGITAGPDGSLWFIESHANQIGRITPGGTVTEFPIPTTGSGPSEITAGSDGNLWFTESAANKIGRITPSGTVTEYPIPTTGSFPMGITAGPDGNLWFTESQANQVGRITTTGIVTEFRLNPPIDGFANTPNGITKGPDGNIWLTEELRNQIGRISVGQLT